MIKLLMINFVMIFVLVPFASAAHYVIGIVEDPLDGSSANDLVITLWDYTSGVSDNQTDIIGPNGNSGQDNIYMINCHLLTNKCKNGDTLTLRVFNQGGYISEEKNVTIGGFGFTQADNITLNSPPSFNSITVEDDLASPSDEINLLPAITKKITCEGVITEYDGEDTLVNVTGTFFDNIDSFYTQADDNNYHYTNNSCNIDYTYGTSNEIYANCSFDIWYYANAQTWNCSLNATDNSTGSKLGNDSTTVNALLALGVPDQIDFGEFSLREVTDEVTVNVTNYGNVLVNLSLSGYGFTENDGNAMNCTLGSTKNISIEYEKFNLTKSTPGSQTHNQFINNYTNLTGNPIPREFNLNYRTNDGLNDANKSSYWRIYVPEGIAGNCLGNVIFGAVQANGV